MRWLLILLSGLAATAQAAESHRRRPRAAALEAARHFLCPHGGTLGRIGGRCGGIGLSGAGPEVRGWDRGLPAASHSQAPCPPGTRPEPALAATGIARCRP